MAKNGLLHWQKQLLLFVPHESRIAHGIKGQFAPDGKWRGWQQSGVLHLRKIGFGQGADRGFNSAGPGIGDDDVRDRIDRLGEHHIGLDFVVARLTHMAH